MKEQSFAHVQGSKAEVSPQLPDHLGQSIPSSQRGSLEGAVITWSLQPGSAPSDQRGHRGPGASGSPRSKWGAPEHIYPHLYLQHGAEARMARRSRPDSTALPGTGSSHTTRFLRDSEGEPAHLTRPTGAGPDSRVWHAEFF